MSAKIKHVYRTGVELSQIDGEVHLEALIVNLCCKLW